MASLLNPKKIKPYIDKKFKGTEKDFENGLSISNLVYIGRLSITTTEEQIHNLFKNIGDIKNMIMGLNKFTKEPCGFCFVEYYNHENAVDAVKYLNGCKLDDCILQVAIDYGFYEGRQFGRSKTGGQNTQIEKRKRDEKEESNKIKKDE